ncbi:hypothetical protein [Cytobacillus oceanisediminis]|uniref:hypothetical protein n=1 Tax=Cytobacillus oceanisediminis TaxID=665099 RepID=UPI003735598D
MNQDEKKGRHGWFMKPVDGLEREKRSPSEVHKAGKWNQCNEKGLHETVKQTNVTKFWTAFIKRELRMLYDLS